MVSYKKYIVFIVASFSMMFVSAPTVECLSQDQNQKDEEIVKKITTLFTEKSKDTTQTVDSALNSFISAVKAYNDVKEVYKDTSGCAVMVELKNTGRMYVYRIVDQRQKTLEKLGFSVMSDTSKSEEDALPDTTDANQEENDEEESGGLTQKETGAPQTSSTQDVSLTYALPESDKALVASGMVYQGMGIADCRKTLAKMLSDRGYKVTSKELKVETFHDLTEYGIIYLDGHIGYWSSFNKGKRIVIDTVTPHSQAKQFYQAYLDKNELIKTLATIWLDHEVPFLVESIGVTADYVENRLKSEGRYFKNRTLLVLAGCNGYLSPDWEEMLYRRGKPGEGAYFVGWKKTVSWAGSAVIMLHMFQLATGSNEQLEAKGWLAKYQYVNYFKKGLVTHYLLMENTPAINIVPFSLAVYQSMALLSRIFSNLDEALVFNWDLDINTSSDFLILAPGVKQILFNHDGEIMLNALCPDYTTLHIGTAQLNLGEQIPFMGMRMHEWLIPKGKIAVNAHGIMTLECQGRKSPPYPVFQWNPKFILSGSNSDGLSFFIETSLVARATPEAFPEIDFKDGLLKSVRPTAILGRITSGSSFVRWQVLGAKTDGEGNVYTYTGGGNKTLSYNLMGKYAVGIWLSLSDNFFSMDLTNLAIDPISYLDESIRNDLFQYTITKVSKDGKVSTSTASLPFSSIERKDDSRFFVLLNDLSIKEGSETWNESMDGKEWKLTFQWAKATPACPGIETIDQEVVLPNFYE